MQGIWVSKILHQLQGDLIVEVSTQVIMCVWRVEKDCNKDCSAFKLL